MSDTKFPTQSMKSSIERAVSLTQLQIEEALQMNTKYFSGEGLANFPAILQALATNYGAVTLFMKKIN